MPTYRSCGDRFLGRWKQGEGETDWREEVHGGERTAERRDGGIRSVLVVVVFFFAFVLFMGADHLSAITSLARRGG